MSSRGPYPTTQGDGGLLLLGSLVGLSAIFSAPPLVGARLAAWSVGLPASTPRNVPLAIEELWAHDDTTGWPTPPPPARTLAISIVLTFALLLAIAASAVMVWRRSGRRAGLATRADISRVLGVGAARRGSRLTRPGLARRPATRELGVPLGRHQRSGLELLAPWVDCHGLIAPTQTGKTLRVLGHQVLAAPGFLLVTSTKPDLLWLTAAARTRAGHRVFVLDTGGFGEHGWSQIQWSPIVGCADVSVAERRADALIQASPAGRSGSASDSFFTAQARQVLAAFLCAADLRQGDVDLVLGWVVDPHDRSPVTALHEAGLHVQARQLIAVQTMVPETRDGTLATISNAVACLSRPDLLRMASPKAGGFDIDAAIEGQFTIYVLGPGTAVGSTAPYVTAFVEEVLERARACAFSRGLDRLDPPAVAILDEVANIAPLPHLPETISDSAGRGVVISYALQSLGQARARWGDDRAAVLLDNSTSLLILGGGKHKGDLTALSALGGQFDAQRVSIGRSHRNHQVTSSTHRQPVLDPSDVRRLAPGHGLLIYRDLPPVLTLHRGLWQTASWKQLSADRDAARRRSVGSNA